MTHLYYIRYLPPKTSGIGTIIFNFSTNREMTLDDARVRFPWVFEQLGFYAMLKCTDQFYNNEPAGKKKK